MPAPLPRSEPFPEPTDAQPVLDHWVRGTMIGIALGLTAIFAIAAWLRPYQDDGTPRTMETHRQLGLPPCTFKFLSGLPCPSCGMTTSFALLVRGDVVNSLRANAVGTLLAATGMAAIPWCLVSVRLQRPLFVVSIERAVMRLIVGFVVLLLLRWAVVLGLALWSAGG